MSWQDDIMAEQEAADALYYMGEAEWREMYGDNKKERTTYAEKIHDQDEGWDIKGSGGANYQRPMGN